MPDKQLWTVVPVKRLDEVKTRLADIMNADERREFVIAMLRDVLTALKASPVDGVLVVTSDERIIDFATSLGADVLVQREDQGINAALDQAVEKLKQEDAGTLIVVPGDVPQIEVRDIQALIEHHDTSGGITLVKARRDGGTNALVCSPPDAIEFLFGPQSAARHMATAQAAGIRPVVAKVAGFADDLDTPNDILRFIEHPRVSLAYDYLSQKQFAERFDGARASGQEKKSHAVLANTEIPS